MARSAVSGRFVQRDSGTCLSFAGGSGATGNIVSLPSGVYNSITTAFTLTAWVKRRGGFTVANQNIFRSTSGDRLWFNYQTDGRLRIYLSDGSNNSTTTTNPVAKDYEYHFVAATWDGATVKIYHDNVLVGSQAVTGTIGWGGGGLNVGGGANTAPILGFIDEPTVFSRALNTTELTDLYYTNIVPSSGLVARYLFNEGSGTSATDASGNSNTGTITGATYSPEVPFKPRQTGRDFGTSISLNGSAGDITTSTPWSSANTSFSMGAWFKSANYKRNRQPIISNGSNGASKTGYGIILSGNSTTDGSIMLLNFNVAWIDCGFKVQDNNWHHAMLTVNGSGAATVYLDGIIRYTGTPTLGTPITDSALGSDKVAVFQGNLDEGRYYTRQLSSAEVSGLYYGIEPTPGPSNWYKFDEGSGTTATDSGSSVKNATITSGTYSTDVFVKPRTVTSGRVAA